jgi:hypothetical protein
MLGTPRQVTYERGAVDYLYRGLHAVMLVALLFKEGRLASELFEFRAYFEEKTGMTEWGDPDEDLRKLRLGKIVRKGSGSPLRGARKRQHR